MKDNYKQAENRLYNLEKMLLQEPAKARSYREAIRKYINDGVSEEVPCDQIAPTDGCPVFYLPHHAVIREDRRQLRQGLCLMRLREIVMVSLLIAA